MKKLIAALLLISTLGACTKSVDETSGNANFTITGVRNVDLTKNSSASDMFTVQVTGGSETVNLSIEDLPGGLHYQITPSSGTPPFTAQVKIWNDFTGAGGPQQMHLTGRSASGTRSYALQAEFAAYKGWKFSGILYTQTGVVRVPGGATGYPQIKTYGGGAGELTISFAQGATLPTKTKTYKITRSAAAADEIRITMVDDPIIYQATGAGEAFGTFTFDSLGHFVFKCTDVEMSNGVDKKSLECAIVE